MCSHPSRFASFPSGSPLPVCARWRGGGLILTIANAVLLLVTSYFCLGVPRVPSNSGISPRYSNAQRLGGDGDSGCRAFYSLLFRCWRTRLLGFVLQRLPQFPWAVFPILQFRLR